MEAAELSRAAFWSETGAEVVVFGNPHRQNDLAPVKAAADSFPELAGHIVVETSGSSGEAKFVCLSRSAFLSSARAVNEHLQVMTCDKWLCALPTFHVGGLAIYARSFCGANEVHAFAEAWHPVTFMKALRSTAATLTSLVPTQVADLVVADVKAPAGIRAVVVGGGRLDGGLERTARQLGWPLLLSYGMTETCSQIATQAIGRCGPSKQAGKGLQLLSHCEARSDVAGRLAIRSDSLFTGYLVGGADGKLTLGKPFDEEGWFITQDRVICKGRRLIYQGRVDRQVKVLGELVDLDQVEAAFRKMLPSDEWDSIAVEAVEDKRRGSRLVPIFEKRVDQVRAAQTLRTYNQNALSLERLEEAIRIDHFPRSPMGKLQRPVLRSLARLR